MTNDVDIRGFIHKNKAMRPDLRKKFPALNEKLKQSLGAIEGVEFVSAFTIGELRTDYFEISGKAGLSSTEQERCLKIGTQVVKSLIPYPDSQTGNAFEVLFSEEL